MVYPKFVSDRLRLRSALIAPNRLIQRTTRYKAAAFVMSPRRSTGMSNASKVSCVLSRARSTPTGMCIVVPSYIPTARISSGKYVLATKGVGKCLRRPEVLKLNRMVSTPSIVGKDITVRRGLRLFRSEIGSNRTPFLTPKSLTTCMLNKVSASRRYISCRCTVTRTEGKVRMLVHRKDTTEGLSTVIGKVIRRRASASNFYFYASSGRVRRVHGRKRVGCGMGQTMRLKLPIRGTLRVTAVRPTEYCNLCELKVVTPKERTSFIVLSGIASLGIMSMCRYNGGVVGSRGTRLGPYPPCLGGAIRMSKFDRRHLGLGRPKAGTEIVRVLRGRVIAGSILRRIP